ncbi:MAG: hypothetical protein V7731_13140 [Amphritea sp.]
MKAFFEVHLKLVVTIWIILLSVLALLYLMNYMKFTSLMSTVVSSQLQVMSTSLERSIIKAEQLGLPLKKMNNLPELLLRAKGRDAQVKEIYVINRQGQALFSTDNIPIESPLSDPVIRRALKSNEQSWTLEEDTTLYSGLQLFDGTQQQMGSIIIVYDKSAYGSTLAQVKLHLLEMTLMIFSVFALLVFVAVRLGFRDVNNVFRLIHTQLSSDKKNVSAQQLKPGTIAHQFALQIEQSNNMKNQVSHELEAMSSQQQTAMSNQQQTVKARREHEKAY